VGKVPAGRALLRRLSGAMARGPHPRLVALAASPRLHPSRRGGAAGTPLWCHCDLAVAMGDRRARRVRSAERRL